MWILSNNPGCLFCSDTILLIYLQLDMLIEHPPFLYRALYPDSLWLLPGEKEKTVYLTFDDGPIPDVTPWVLDLLDKYNIKATFFCVGENVSKYPHIYDMILEHGHRTGNHTHNHLQGIKEKHQSYIENVEQATKHIESNLFRPPHGHMKFSQYRKLKKEYKIIMWDVVTRDYSKFQTPEKVFKNVQKHTRNGSIIVFHDSLKAEKNMKYALPKSIDWLLENEYTFKLL